ncbi:hypothetical protein Golax_024659, partial [Gossypium laxum]|nr:hypothetical protein [Gossypium laxum]
LTHRRVCWFFPDLTRVPCWIASTRVRHPKLPSPGNEGEDRVSKEDDFVWVR